MKSILGLAFVGMTLAACAAQTGTEEPREGEPASEQTENGAPAKEEAKEETGTATSAFVVGCEPNLPLCACVLKGQAACNDDDHDGVVNLDDNCDNKPNPGQADCDHDGIGDACDKENWKVVSRGTEKMPEGKVYTGRLTCEREDDVGNLQYAEVTMEGGTQDYEMRLDCSPFPGPNKYIVAKHPSQHTCWETQHPGCDATAEGLPTLGQVCH